MKQLLFMGGFPSGGTDLTKTVVNAHPNIEIRGEMPFLISLKKEGYSQSSAIENEKQFQDFLRVLGELDVYNRIGNLNCPFSDYTKQENKPGIDAALWMSLSTTEASIRGFKTPQYTEQLPELYELFPTAKFLIIVRDVRDVCLSWDKKWGKDMILCADKWARRMSSAYHFTKSGSDGRTLFVRYEDLLDNTKTIAELICNFLSIPFSTSMLEHEKHTEEVVDGKLNYGKSIISDNKNKWRHKLSKKKILRIEQIAFDTMSLFDYPVSVAESEKKINLLEYYYGRLRDVYATIFIGNRSLSQENKYKIRIKSIFIELKKIIS